MSKKSLLSIFLGREIFESDWRWELRNDWDMFTWLSPESKAYHMKHGIIPGIPKNYNRDIVILGLIKHVPHLESTDISMIMDTVFSFSDNKFRAEWKKIRSSLPEDITEITYKEEQEHFKNHAFDILFGVRDSLDDYRRKKLAIDKIVEYLVQCKEKYPEGHPREFTEPVSDEVGKKLANDSDVTPEEWIASLTRDYDNEERSNMKHGEEDNSNQEG